MKDYENILSEQEQDIIAFIQKNGSITTIQAMYNLGCARLSARIFDMREKGIPLKREMISVENRKGKTCRVARYWIAA